MSIDRFQFSFRYLIFCLAVLGHSLVVNSASAEEQGFELRDGDRVVLLGGTYIERIQTYGYLETLLTSAYPNRNVTFRNLGWSGDDVSGLARAVFGAPADGFKRLQRDVTEVKPSVIIICYGANEAHAGADGVDAFTDGFDRLLETLKPTGARIVFLSPLSYEHLGPPLPSPKSYNDKLKLYRDAIKKIAKDRGCHYVDLYRRLDRINEDNISKLPAIRDRLTDNGVHLTEYGYWRTAPRVARGLGISPATWRVDLDVSNKSYDATGTMLSNLTVEEESIEFHAVDLTLPYSSPPKHLPRGGRLMAPHSLVRFQGLEPGKYGFQIDDRPTIMADHEQWATGVRINRGDYISQIDELRQTIFEKNELYFHRHRPQNETYLFLFRKHEQGNNAVEIPEFEKLVNEQEQQIAQLRKPVPQTYKLVRVERETEIEEDDDDVEDADNKELNSEDADDVDARD